MTIGPAPICFKCKHFRCKNFLFDELKTIYLCDAFPDKDGIPDEVLTGENHDTPIEGDHGIRFELKE